jgi:hypothetical protein
MLVIWMATAMRRSNTDGITQCSMSSATPEATGHQHQVTTCSILPQRPPAGQQANKQQSTNTPKKLVILMAALVHRYNTVCIAQ